MANKRSRLGKLPPPSRPAIRGPCLDPVLCQHKTFGVS